MRNRFVSQLFISFLYSINVSAIIISNHELFKISKYHTTIIRKRQTKNRKENVTKIFVSIYFHSLRQIVPTISYEQIYTT